MVQHLLDCISHHIPCACVKLQKFDQQLSAHIASEQFPKALQVLQKIQELNCENIIDFNKPSFLAGVYFEIAECCITPMGKKPLLGNAGIALEATQRGLVVADNVGRRISLIYMKAAAHYYRNECDAALDALRNVTILHNYPEHVARIEEQRANPAQSPLENNPFAY